jgi:hypothetical protein
MAALRNSKVVWPSDAMPFGLRVRYALARWAAGRKAARWARLHRRPANGWVAAPVAAFAVAASWGLVKEPFLAAVAWTAAAAMVGYGIWVICAALLRRLHR